MKLNFWLFVSGLFLLYGIIIFACGVYYIMTGATGFTHQFHPSLWWGGILLLASIVFFIISKKNHYSSSEK